jgi:serine/threonine-protein kinase
MGLVFAARHRLLGQRVAVKTLLPELAQDPEAVERFLREARASTLLKSERVVRVLDVGSCKNGAPFMIMEYLEGEDLQQSIQRGGSLTAPAAVNYVLQAAEAVAEAHSLGIIHRDLKPANLFLTTGADGSPLVKVLDFGISKVTAPGRRGLTRTNAIMGSLGYMSPEQLRSTKHVDQRTDVWGLGVVLYELLAGGPAFEGEHLAAISVKIALESPKPLEEIRPDVASGLVSVVVKCLAKEPVARYQNMAELAAALEPFAPRDAARLVERIGRLAGAGGPLAVRAHASDAAMAAREAPTEKAWARSEILERQRQKIVFVATAGGVALLSALLSVIALGKGSALQALLPGASISERASSREVTAAPIVTSPAIMPPAPLPEPKPAPPSAPAVLPVASISSTKPAQSRPLTARAPQCPAGKAVSNGHCCPTGSVWQGEACIRRLVGSGITRK